MTVFVYVNTNKQVAAAAMKFTDIRVLENPPNRCSAECQARTEAVLVLLLSRIAGAAIDATSEPKTAPGATSAGSIGTSQD
jgi:hypothetical protein